ncbi:MAG: IPT/TIG domain-containing protein [Myxococcota bacterium]|nr:IPT/TIG domain-containing protein [Myxococcota bacterium]
MMRSVVRRVVGAMLVLVGWVGIAGTATIGLAGCEEGEGGELAVLNLEPRAGASQGEQPVRISGSNFRQDIGYTVYFGATRATQVTIMDDNTLLVATPSHDPGAVDVVIAADDGPAYRIVNGFTYNDQGGNVMEQVGEGGGTAEERY